MTLCTSLVCGISSGRQERNQCDIFEPQRPPVDGIKCLGSEDIARMILGSKLIVAFFERTIETSIVMLGGYSRGAGSKAAGIAIGNGYLNGCKGRIFRNSRRG